MSGIRTAIRAIPKELTLDEWKFHIQSSLKSNMSHAAYCRQHNLIYHRFIYWKKKLSSAVQLSQSFALLKFGSQECSQPLPLKRDFSGSSSSIRLRVKDVVVDVGDDFLPVTLGKVIQTLRRI